jgi:hypothetical protein
MIRPSGKLKRFMSNADYQVSTKRTKKKNTRSFGHCLKAGRFANAGPNEIRLGRSDVAPAPLELLPDYTEERCVGQGGQWKRFPCFPDGDERSAFNVDGSSAIQRQVHWIIGMTRFDFDDRFIRDNDRAVRKNVRANRRDDEHAGLRVENRSPGRQ